MTDEEKHHLVKQHYMLNGMGNYEAAGELLTDDFSLTIPAYMPFGGTWRGKDAFREVIPIVRAAIAVKELRFVTTTLADNYAVEVVEFILEDHDGPPLPVAELIEFRGNRICKITPFYNNPFPMIEIATRRMAAARENAG